MLRRRLLLVVLTVMLGLIAAYASSSRTTTYVAQSTIYVGSRQLSGPTLSQDIQLGLQRVVLTFAQMVHSRPIAEAAVQKVHVARSPDRVVASTTAIPVSQTQLLKIQVKDPDPRVAQQLANGISDAFVERIAALEPGTAADQGQLPQLPAYIFERARLPLAPQSTGLTRRLLLGGLFGFVAATALVFLLEYLDITIKSAQDAERRLGLPVLGVIPFTSPPPVPAANAAPQLANT